MSFRERLLFGQECHDPLMGLSKRWGTKTLRLLITRVVIRCPTAVWIAARSGARGYTVRCSTPLYSLSGRMREFEAACSMMWAVQPVMRLETNNGVKVGVSNPMRW